jgi:hypothetical protein
MTNDREYQKNYMKEYRLKHKDKIKLDHLDTATSWYKQALEKNKLALKLYLTQHKNN